MFKKLNLKKIVGKISRRTAEIVEQYAVNPPKFWMMFEFQRFLVIQKFVIIIKAIQYKYNGHYINCIIIKDVIISMDSIFKCKNSKDQITDTKASKNYWPWINVFF